MIFKDEEGNYVDWQEKGDEIKMTKYIPRNLELAKANYESRKDANNGFTPDRQWRKIGSIDPNVFFSALKVNPDLQEDPKALRKFLKLNEDCRTVEGGI